jgi:antitoxin (DNA-binding transcriptional repressor) of toxin-antitoxin stability system
LPDQVWRLARSGIAGAEIIITRRKKPVARIIPEGGCRLEDVQRVTAGLEALENQIAASPAPGRSLSWDEFKSCIEQGRW